MIEFILGGIFGFAVGCTLKEFLKGKVSSLNNNTRNPEPTSNNRPGNKDNNFINSSSNVNRTNETRFNLSSISSLFDKYEVELLGETSFSILLDKIERETYKNTLSMFSSTVHNPKEMMDLLEHGNTMKEGINPQYMSEGIYASDSYINKLLDERGVQFSSITTAKEKVQLLVSFQVSKGLNRFKRTLGPSLEQFISDYESNKDVTLLFEEIIKNINNDLSLFS